jgi:hypothetical protein
LGALKQGAGEADTVGEFFANNRLDKPFKAGTNAQLPYIRLVGKALGFRELESAQPGQMADPVSARCTNLGGMLASALTQLPPEKRQAALEEIGGLAWTQDVLRMASQLNGRLPATEAVHFALTMHFIQGTVDVKLGKPSPGAAAYSKALSVAKVAEQQGRAQSLGITRRGGFQGFGVESRGTPVTTTPPPTKTLPTATLASGAALYQKPVADAKGARWMLVSPNGRFVLFTSDKGAGLYLVMRVKSAPIGYQEQVTPDELLTDATAEKSVLWQGKNFLAAIPRGTTATIYSASMEANGTLVLRSQRSDGVIEAYDTLPPLIPLTNARATVPGARLLVQDDGNVVAYGPDGRAMWELGTYKQALPFLSSAFVAPADIPAVDRKAINIIDCEFLLSGALALYGNNESIPGVKEGIDKKIAGIRIAFQRVFARAANNAEVTYFGRLRWCVDADGLVKGQTSTLERKMEEVRAALIAGRIPNTTALPVADLDKPPRESIVDQVVVTISKAADWTADILCQGFKALLGETAGGVLCALFRAILTVTGTVAATIFAILGALAEGILGFAQAFASSEPDLLKKTANAFMALFRAMTKAIFFVAAPVVVPTIFVAKGAGPGAIADGFKELEFLANRVAQKDPLFPLTVTLAVITFVFIPIPTPNNINALILACLPMSVALISKGLKALPVMAAYTLEVVEDGVEKVMKLCLMLFQGFMALKDVIGQITERLQDSIANGGLGAFLGDKPPIAMVADLIKRLRLALDPKNPKSITASIERINLNDIGQTAIALLTLIPAIIIALAGPAIDADPSLQRAIDRWYAIAQSVPGELAKQEPQIAKEAGLLVALLSQPQRTTVVTDAERTLDLTNSAKMVAETLWQRVGRDGVAQTDRDTYFTAMRQAWVAQGGKV